MAEPSPTRRDAARFTGAASGKTLRAHQARPDRELLPRARDRRRATLAAGAPLFAFAPREIWLEIGFGGGEHLLAQAHAHPDVGFIGCEPFINGVAKALAGVERHGLANVRLRADDARALIAAAPDAALSRIFILYPDPWPKRRHNKRRVISSETVAELARVAKPGATVRFATDIDDYAGWTLARFLASPYFRWLARIRRGLAAAVGRLDARPAMRRRRATRGGRRSISRSSASERGGRRDLGRMVTKLDYP